jgi:uncharacterized membrane protein
MYTIIGGDGKEYGPVSADQVQAWIAGGRANLETKVKALGTDEWKRIADIPGLAAAGAAGSAAPAAAAVLAGRAGKLDIISCYERSWALLKANFWQLVGVSFLMMVLIGSFGYVHSALVSLYVFFVPALGAGWHYYFLLKIRGQPVTLGDAFAGFSRAYVPLLAIGLLLAIFVAVGLVFLILPGIYLWIAYSFAYLLAVDKRTGIWESMETSRLTITRQWWQMLGLQLLAIVFFILGFAALGVGIFVAAPLHVGAVVYAYEDLCNPKQ